MHLSKIAFLSMILVVLIGSILSYGFNPAKMANEKEPPESKGFAVIELFTSEGCSSCPPADQLVSKVLSENKKNIYILSYHVDYWDRLGWKDNFSQAAFSNRQKQYSRYLSLDGVYTPQIVLNGTDQFVGSNETHLRSSLAHLQQESDLDIEVSKTNDTFMHLSYKITGKDPGLLNIALIQPEAVTEVKRGENGGRKLHHVNVVREFKTIEPAANEGSMDIVIPEELHTLSFKVIAFTQQKSNFKITGAAQTTIKVNGKNF